VVQHAAQEGQFSKESAAWLIQCCCGDLPNLNDNRIQSLFNNFDGNKDGVLDKEEFLRFYQNCCRGEKATTVRENLKAFNVRPDLKKWSEIEEDSGYAPSELPRLFLSQQDDLFTVLFELLQDSSTDFAQEIWGFIQMLCTNKTMYTNVLTLNLAKDAQSGKVDWAKFFDKSKAFNLLYTLQIVQAILEDGS